MKLIIAGGRFYQFTTEDTKFLNELHAQYNIEEVVTGKCKIKNDTGQWVDSGADWYGEQWGVDNNLVIKEFPVLPWEWKELGKKAGPLRNRKMANYADAVVLFSGGNGTQSMKEEALKAGLIIFDRS